MQTDGHVFFELYVADLRWYVGLFRDALGMTVAEDDDDFVKLKSAHGTALLNGMDDLPAAHPFAGFKAVPTRGFGVELGVVIDDIDAAWARAQALRDCLVTPIATQPWAMRDFRVTTKEGYFLRVTTSDPEERTAT